MFIIVCACKWQGYAGILLSQQAAQRWTGESEQSFAQVSVFFSDSNKTEIEDVRAYRESMDAKLVAAGLDKPETGSLHTDAWCGFSAVDVKGDRATSLATIVGVGGEFTLFHPYELLSGSFLTADDLMDDRVVLDYDLAWKLFGASDLEGLSVSINNKPYYIAGVIRRESDGFTKMAYTDENPMIFMSFAAMKTLDENTGITCLEIAMADPITSYAKSVAAEYFKGRATVVENSARYEYSNIISYFTEFGKSQIQSSGAALPYWENAARISEAYIARLLLFIILLSLYPLFCLGWLIVDLIRTLVKIIKRGTHEAYEAWDDRYARMAAHEEKVEARKLAKREKHEAEDSADGDEFPELSDDTAESDGADEEAYTDTDGKKSTKSHKKAKRRVFSRGGRHKK